MLRGEEEAGRDQEIAMHAADIDMEEILPVADARMMEDLLKAMVERLNRVSSAQVKEAMQGK